ncbi:RHS repeat-associated core domain-containing protein [Amycolatopsis sp. NPDC005232]|uniref:RHS repeat-associated core domain-containing protein n=1 Tax=Amycolatopsis sp. NPDC005232 TaxID=3157027 RepID=UPI0033BC7E64
MGDDKGFIGGAQDESGLTNLGAREYDPVTGRFISVDPVMDLDDPQQLNGYAYANNSPVTNSDPNGLFWKTVSVQKRMAVTVMVWALVAASLFFPVLMLVAVTYWVVQVFVYRIWIDPPWGIGGGGGSSAHDQALKDAGLSQAESKEAKKAAADKRSWVDIAIQVGGDILQEIIGVKGIVDNCIKDFNLVACGWEVLTALPWGKILKGGKIVEKIVTAFKDTLSWIRRWDKAMADLRAVESAEQRLSSAARVCKVNSFVPGTFVLLADGKKKPIESVRLGDMVVAVDPDTGATTKRSVVATIVGFGVKDLIEVGIAGSAPVVATKGHRFWSVDRSDWVTAGELRPGSRLRGSDGGALRVATIAEKLTVARVHNLTVDVDHTYQVATESSPVLVHNTGGMNECSEAAFQGVLHIREEAAKEVAKGKPANHHFDMSDDDLADYLDGYVERGGGNAMSDGTTGWYGIGRRVMIILRNEYSMTAYKISYEDFAKNREGKKYEYFQVGEACNRRDGSR